eukprot:TRINITY_DN23998_c0_g1_i1.p1 TRINITY_DN23998_c0_g1~~TRINITY_DN23998_c0_g1_i1.p1  ORF type:complete len:235 (+),score=56.05 TRINITY_DN23998_c0_g1_i1:58-705(+)
MGDDALAVKWEQRPYVRGRSLRVADEGLTAVQRGDEEFRELTILSSQVFTAGVTSWWVEIVSCGGRKVPSGLPHSRRRGGRLTGASVMLGVAAPDADRDTMLRWRADDSGSRFQCPRTVACHPSAVAWHSTGRVLSGESDSCPDGAQYDVGDRVGLTLDMDARTLSLHNGADAVSRVRLPDGVDSLCAAASLLREGDEITLVQGPRAGVDAAMSS